MTSFALATSVLSAAILLLASPVASSSTEYKCSGAEYCKISSKGGICTPIGEGLPVGNTFMPTLISSGASSASTPMPYACIGISSTDLADGGGSGNCVVECPGSCTVTPNVVSPCAGAGDPNPTDPNPTSGAKGITSVALASMTGAVVAAILL